MLLVDGMIGKVGKFGDRDLYLPEVKAQLREMMSIIDETSILTMRQIASRLRRSILCHYAGKL